MNHIFFLILLKLIMARVCSDSYTAEKEYIDKLECLKYDGTYHVGRRKSSVALVSLVPAKRTAGSLIVNSKHGWDYFVVRGHHGQCFFQARSPMTFLGQQCSERDELGVGLIPAYNIVASVRGGGLRGQAGAIKLGLSRALASLDTRYRSSLRSAGFLTSDARRKERKKYGLKKARKAPQFSKR